MVGRSPASHNVAKEEPKPVSDEEAAAPRPRSSTAWRHELGQWLANPFVVTVVAAILGGLLIPHFTRSWQDHQKELEIKTDLVGQMSESVGDAVATGRFIAADLVPPASQQGEWNDGYRAWTTASASIGAGLRAYVGSDVGSDWRSFSDTVTNFFLLSANNDPDSRRRQVEELMRDGDLRRHVQFKPAGWAALRGPKTTADFRLAYPELARGILERQDELVQRVLDSDVSGF
jgi:hypothetical protein